MGLAALVLASQVRDGRAVPVRGANCQPRREEPRLIASAKSQIPFAGIAGERKAAGAELLEPGERAEIVMVLTDRC